MLTEGLPEDQYHSVYRKTQDLEFLNFGMCEHYESFILVGRRAESPRNWQPTLSPGRSRGFNAYAAGGGAVIDEDAYQLMYKVEGEERNPSALELLVMFRRGDFSPEVED